MGQGAIQLLGSQLLVCVGDWGTPGSCAGSGLCSGSLYLTLKGNALSSLPGGKAGVPTGSAVPAGLGLPQGGPRPCALSPNGHICSSGVDTSVAGCGTLT